MTTYTKCSLRKTRTSCAADGSYLADASTAIMVDSYYRRRERRRPPTISQPPPSQTPRHQPTAHS